MIPDLPENADLETCMDSALRQLCDAITERHDLPGDIRSLLCNAAATLVVDAAAECLILAMLQDLRRFLPPNRRRHSPMRSHRKYIARSRS